MTGTEEVQLWHQTLLHVVKHMHAATLVCQAYCSKRDCNSTRQWSAGQLQLEGTPEEVELQPKAPVVTQRRLLVEPVVGIQLGQEGADTQARHA